MDQMFQPMEFLKSVWQLLAVTYAAAAMAGVYLIKLFLSPPVWVLRRLVVAHAGAWAGWPWAFASLTAALCSSLSCAGNGGRALSWQAALSAYLALGAFRCAAVWLMEKETTYETYELMAEHFSGGLTGWFHRRLRHPSDVLWIRHMAVSSLVHVPATLSLVLWGGTSWFACSWYVVTILAAIKTPSANHNLGHFRPFQTLKLSHALAAHGLAFWYHFFVEFLEGDIPHLTDTAHDLIHHKENNGKDDFESTYACDRTSFVSTSKLYFECMWSYSFGAPVVLYLWHNRARKVCRNGLWRIVLGLIFAYGVVLLIIPIAGLPVAILMLLTRLVQSGLKYGDGAYITHTFVDPEDPANIFRSCVDFAVRGTLTHGGAVHILHHLHPGCHWTTLKSERRKFVPEYARHGAIVFPLELAPFVQPLLYGRHFTALARWTLRPEDIARYEDNPTMPKCLPRQEDLAPLARTLQLRSRPAGGKPPGRIVSAIDALAGWIMLRAAGGQFLLRSDSILR